MIKDINSLFQEALALHQNESLAAAETFYKKILEKQPDAIDVIFLLGTLNIQQGNLDKATMHLKKTIALKPDHVAAHNNLGTALQSQGRLSEAVVIYNRVIELKPDYAEARINLGNVFQEQGKHDEAIECYNRAISLKPDYAEVHYNLGNALKEKYKNGEAVASYRRAIKLNPNYIEAHSNLGSVLQRQNRFDEAVASYRQAIELNPGHVEIHNNLGAVLKEQGKLDEAAARFRHAISLKPDYAEAHNNLGTILKEQHKLDEAIKSFYHSIELNPNYAEAHNNLAAVRQEQHKVDEAIVNYKQAISLKPDYAEAHNNLGTALKEQNKTDEAVASYRYAISLKPDYAEAHYNLGSIFSEQSRLDEAMECYKQAISLKPDYAEAYNNLGNALQEQHKLDGAVTYYNRSIAIKPDYAEAHFNKSLTLLLAGNFEDAWPEYEWRLRKKDCTDCTSHTFQQPQWDGKPLNGRSILIQAEQGFGDTIQFLRYLPMVKANGGHVIFECQKNLFRLLKDCLGIDDIVELTSTSTPAAQSDFYALLLSLPGIFGTTLNTIPSDVPYITVDSRLETQWKMQLIHDNDFKIGIVWAGNSENKKIYHKKSCTLNNFATISEIPDLSFYSLQKGPASVEINHPPKGMKIINLGDELNDFADTAALIANLDMVISIDTAVAHLAGAIGKPVWTLLHSTPDWRWMLNRDDSPWYPRTNCAEDFPRPSQNDVARPDDLVGRGLANNLAGLAGMRLFRQTKPNNWTGVFEQVKKALLYKLDTERQISEVRM